MKIRATLLCLCLALLCAACKKSDPDNKKFIGTYRGISVCQTDSMTVSVTRGTSDSRIFVGVGSYGTVYADVNGTNFTIPKQTLSMVAGGAYISGYGSVSGPQLSMSYYLNTTLCSFAGSQ